MNFFNDLFDSVNGSDQCDNELRCAVTEDSAHHKFWADAHNVLEKMCYVDKATRRITKSVPTLRNWILTLDGFQNLWKILTCKYGFTSLKTCYCNQDPIENFFGQVRSHAIRNINPTPRQFEDSFIALLFSNMKSILIIGGNCETVEDSFMLLSLETYLKNNLQNAEVCNVRNNDDDNDNDNDADDCKEPLEMLTGVVIRDDSSHQFLLDHFHDIIIAIIKHFNNCVECDSSLKHSNTFSISARQIICRLFKLLQTRSHRHNILKVLLQHFENWSINMDWHECEAHRANMFMTMVRVIAVKVLVWWCTKKNISIRKAKDDTNIDLLCYKDILQIKKARETYQLEKSERKKMLHEYRLSVNKQFKYNSEKY